MTQQREMRRNLDVPRILERDEDGNVIYPRRYEGATGGVFTYDDSHDGPLPSLVPEPREDDDDVVDYTAAAALAGAVALRREALAGARHEEDLHGAVLAEAAKRGGETPKPIPPPESRAGRADVFVVPESRDVALDDAADLRGQVHEIHEKTGRVREVRRDLIAMAVLEPRPEMQEEPQLPHTEAPRIMEAPVAVVESPHHLHRVEDVALSGPESGPEPRLEPEAGLVAELPARAPVEGGAGTETRGEEFSRLQEVAPSEAAPEARRVETHPPEASLVEPVVADGAAQAESQRAESRVSVRAPEAHVLAPHVPEARAPERAPEGAAVSPRRETPEVELPEGVVREGGAMGTSFFFVVPAQARGLGFEPRIHLGVDDGSGAALGLIAERAWGLSRRIDAAIEARHESRDVLRAEFDEDSGYDSVQAQAGRIQENEEGRAREGDKERRARHDEDVRRRNELVREGVRDNLEVQAELAETDEDLTYTEIGAFEVGDVMRASGLDNHWLSGNAYITPIPDLQPAPDAHQAFSAAEDPQAAAASDNEGLARQVGLPQPVMPEARANPHLSLLDEVLKPLPPMPE